MSDMTGSDLPKNPLSIEDCFQLAEASLAAGEASAFCAVLDTIVARTIGHRLFTISRFYPDRMELERVYSSDPAAYPVGGRKQKGGTPWSDMILRDGEIFLGRDNDAIRGAFDDHEKIIALGLGSIINVPVRRGGTVLGTMNSTHCEGWYMDTDRDDARLLSTFLAPWLV
jgi:hypothetical protein